MNYSQAHACTIVVLAPNCFCHGESVHYLVIGYCPQKCALRNLKLDQVSSVSHVISNKLQLILCILINLHVHVWRDQCFWCSHLLLKCHIHCISFAACFFGGGGGGWGPPTRGDCTPCVAATDVLMNDETLLLYLAHCLLSLQDGWLLITIGQIFWWCKCSSSLIRTCTCITAFTCTL